MPIGVGVAVVACEFLKSSMLYSWSDIIYIVLYSPTVTPHITPPSYMKYASHKNMIPVEAPSINGTSIIYCVRYLCIVWPAFAFLKGGGGGGHEAEHDASGGENFLRSHYVIGRETFYHNSTVPWLRSFAA